MTEKMVETPKNLTRAQFERWLAKNVPEEDRGDEKWVEQQWYLYEHEGTLTYVDSGRTKNKLGLGDVVDRLATTDPKKGILGEIVTQDRGPSSASADETPAPAPEQTPEKKAQDFINGLPAGGLKEAMAAAATQWQNPQDYSVFGDSFNLDTKIVANPWSAVTATERNRKQTLPAGQLLADLYKIPPAMLGEVQRTLFEKGWFPEGVTLEDVQMGRVDDATQAAYVAAMKEAARYNLASDEPLTIQQVIDMGDPNAKKKAKAAEKQGTKTRTMNPISVKEVGRQAGLRMLGTPMSEADQQAFADYYRQQEEIANASERRVDAAGSGNMVAAPGPDEAAAAWLREKDPAGVHGFGMLSRYNEFMSMLSSAG